MKISTRLRHGLLLAAAAPTSALSLSNFQLITSSSVPFACILAYNQQLANCALGDFTQQTLNQQRRDARNTCSAACQAGIALAQQTIKTSCSSGTSTSLSSVLGVALTGDLIGLLCGGTGANGANGANETDTLSSTTASPTGDSNNVNGVATGAATASTAANTFFATTLAPTITSTIADSPAQQQQQQPTPAAAATTDDTAEASLSLLLSSLSSLSFFSQAAAEATAAPVAGSFIQSAGPAGETGASITVKTGNAGNAASPSPTAATEAVPRESQLSGSDGRGGGSPFDAQVVNGALRLGPSIAVAAVGSIVAVLF